MSILSYSIQGKKIVFNGKFLTQKVTGVQRYAREILLELDKLLDDKDDAEILVPKNAEDVPGYRNIKIIQKGLLKGNLWEQISLPLYVIRTRSLCVNLCNIMPILTPHIAVAHDISFKRNPRHFSGLFSLWYRFVYRLCIKRVKHIVTVSEFSKSEICSVYRINPMNVTVAYNAWQHYNRIGFNESILSDLKLTANEFYFSLSTMAPNKNLLWIVNNAKSNSRALYIVSGAVNKKVFGTVYNCEIPDNLLILDYLSDSDAKTLMRDCKAFLFPSFYEGFGIPPLEALASGCKHIVISDIACLKEIYGDCAHYINPNDYSVDLDTLIKERVTPADKVLEKYNWEKSALELCKTIQDQ